MGARGARKRSKTKGCGCLIVIVVGILMLVAGVLGFMTDEEFSSSRPDAIPRSDETPFNDDDSTVTHATFISIVDGDTIETDLGTVRLIGIDTPERGECGYAEAAAVIDQHIEVGDEILLRLPAGQNDTDRYERLLRYVSTQEGIDIGLTQLMAGSAVARYDSQDGYPEHPQESSYREAQLAVLLEDGTVQATGCESKSIPDYESPQPTEAPSADASWWSSYPSCAALKRNTVGHPTGPFSVSDPAQLEIYNWFAHGTGHRGDGDGDGLACE
ncbi:thermonuclease family protein [Leucobacter denitrificans]|uniref:Thermonuclease family protein n=1 Tax=Leucobacter denitrificans TaxID=683042 RepID=A0A7G9S2L2_9MICO|nr:thermonuclease family protein [Leucobacter denitrificans]QNN62087.1 thermonuclease family protein [Leucobacter denitrificans]